jgi:membrane-associated phospholipid phosphatase
VTNTHLTIRGVRIRATDALILFALAMLSLLALVFFRRVPDWWVLVLKNAAVAAGYLLLLHYRERAQGKFLRFLLRLTPVVLSYACLFGAVDKLQHIIHEGWLDTRVLDLEQAIFGVQPTLWIQSYITPALTEWMMFTYVVYVPLYPVLCGIIYYKRGELAMEDCFFTLGLTNILCDIGFILYPVAGPLPTIGHLYTTKLDGYVWTWLGQAIQTHLHYVGGSIPSPHCAAATIMWAMAYRYHRALFWILAPVVLSLYVSTFYGRFHYVTDAVVGVITAFVALAIAPLLMRGWDRLVARTATPVR